MPVCPRLDLSPQISDIVLPWSASHRGVPIIIDNGSYQCRAGFASQPEPHMIFKNVVCKPRFKKDAMTVGNDIDDLESVRSQLKTAFDRNIVTQFETQEFVLDHIFSKLGLSNESSIQHPIVMSEAMANPPICRSQMSELLFECYNVPAVSYFVDSLASWYSSVVGSLPQLPASKSGLIMAFGYHTIHLIPMSSDGRPVMPLVRRINIGGAHVDYFMQRLLQLKYPSHSGLITLNLAEHLVKHCCRVATPYRETAESWRDSLYEEKHAISYQLPYANRTSSLGNNQQSLAQQSRIEKMREAQRARAVGRLQEERDQLQQLESLQLLFTQGYNELHHPRSQAELRILLKNSLKKLHFNDRESLDEAVGKKQELVERLQNKLNGNKEESKAKEVENSKKSIVAPARPTTFTLKEEADIEGDSDNGEAMEEGGEEEEDHETILKRRRIEALKLAAAKRREATRLFQQRRREKRLLALKEVESKRGYDYLAWITNIRNQRRHLWERIQQRSKEGQPSGLNIPSAGDVSTITVSSGNMMGSGGGSTNPSASGGSTLNERKAKQQRRMQEMTAQLMSTSSASTSSTSRGGRVAKTPRKASTKSKPNTNVNDTMEDSPSSAAADDKSDVVPSSKVKSSSGVEMTTNEAVSSDEDDGELLTQLDLILTQHDPAFSKETYAAVSNEVLDEYFKIHITSEQVKCSEVLFHPNLIGCEQASLSECLDYLLLPTNQRNDASAGFTCNYLLLTGGSSQLPGLLDRAAYEVKQRLPVHSADCLKVLLPTNPSLDAWRGVQMWCATQNFPRGVVASYPQCVSRRDYNELGHDYLMEHAISNVRYSS